MSTQEHRLTVLIAGGGTAGHVLPGVAIAQALVRRGIDRETIAFAGGNRGVERRLVTEAGFALTELSGRGIQRRLTFSNVTAALALARGLFQGVLVVTRRRPRAVVVLGGYASLGCGIGAVLLRRPLVLCEQNARAGAVNRLLRHWARRSVVAFEETDLPRRVVTGNPLRAELVAAAREMAADPERARRDAREALGLSPDTIVVLVTTGSLGARTVNDAMIELVGRMEGRSDVEVRHVTGRRDYADVRVRAAELVARGQTRGPRYHLVEYEDHMAQALSAADVAVTRAGGGVAELAAFGVPAILVPLPIAPRDHQRANAQSLVRAGGALLLDDADCDAEHLGSMLGPLLDDEVRREAMASAMRSMAHIDAADAAAEVIAGVAGVD